MSRTSRQATAGFTIVELILVIAITGVLAAYAVQQSFAFGVGTIRTQGELLARDLRHAQRLSMAWGRSLTVTFGSNGYTVACTSGSDSPCDNSPVIDPVTGSAFSRTMGQGVTISGSSTVVYNTLGAPSAAASVTLAKSGANVVISVSATSGDISVSAS